MPNLVKLTKVLYFYNITFNQSNKMYPFLIISVFKKRKNSYTVTV